MNFKLSCCNNNLRHTFLFVWLSIWTLIFFLICHNFNIWLSFDYSIFSFLSSFLSSFLFSSLSLLFYYKTVYWLPRIFFLLLLDLFYLKVSLSNITDWSHFRRSFLREHIDIVHVTLQLTTYIQKTCNIYHPAMQPLRTTCLGGSDLNFGFCKYRYAQKFTK